MQAQKLQVKFFAGDEISETALVPVFHDWIRERGGNPRFKSPPAWPEALVK